MGMDGAADERLEQQLRGGEDDVLGALFESYRAQLTRMVTFRLDPRLVGRIDADDVLQDAFVEAEKRLGAFRGDDKPFLVWIRLITQQTMINLHRRHLGAGKRSAGKEVAAPESGAMSGLFIGQITSPSRALMREELRLKIEEALRDMDDIDREVLMLRHFEDMANKDVAIILGIQENAASNRYVRALGRLKAFLGGFDES